MSGVGSTNAMKKGSANNPFLAFSEADMKGYLNSAYTGCIVKYNGDPIVRQISDENITVPEYAQNLVFLNKDLNYFVNYGALKITKKATDGTETVQYLRNLFYNLNTYELTWDVPESSGLDGWVNFWAITNVEKPASVLALTNATILWTKPERSYAADKYPSWWPVLDGWQYNAVNTDLKITLWGYGEDVSFVYIDDGNVLDYSYIPYRITPYIPGELYKVVYGDNEYYYEEFYYIGEERTTAGAEDVAPGKTFYDFTGTKQTGTGTRANPFLARTVTQMNTFNDATYYGKFVKFIGKTNDTYIKNAIYQVTNDATEYDRYMLLPTLENEGTADDLASGKELINSKGEVVVGTAKAIINKLLSVIAKTVTEITAEDLEGATKIGDYAFYGCSSLTSIMFPSTITFIGSRAFSYCSNLTSITFIDNVIVMQANAFYNCNKLQDIYITNLSAWCNSSGLNVITECNTLTKNLYLNNKLVVSVTIPDDVKTIASGAFSCCRGLTSVTIPDSVTRIGSYAFEYCSGLTSITMLSTTPPLLGSSTFNDISSSVVITVPKGALEAYKTATGWSTYADKIVEAIE